MKPTKLGRALMVALSAASPKIAQDSSLGALVGEAKKKSFDKDAVIAKLVAMDTDINTGSLGDIIEAIMGVEENPEPESPPVVITGTADAGGAAGIIDFLQSKGLDAADLDAVSGMLDKLQGDKPAEDAEEVEKKAEEKADEKVKAAMDSMRQDFRDLEVAKAAVRPIVGDVIGMDSADNVYRFALDQLKVDHEGVSGVALAKMLKASATKSTPAPSIANDAATVKAIPGLERFR